MTKSAATCRLSKPSPLVSLTAALAFVGAGLTPVFAGDLEPSETAIGSANAAQARDTLGGKTGTKVPQAGSPTLAPPPPALSWTTYVNPRFGLRIDMPQGLFLPTPPPENGDGQAFVANDGASRFRVWGSNNVLAETAESAMESFAAALAPGAIRSSEVTGAGGFETVALRGGTLVFHREIVTPDVIFGFEAELDDPGDSAMAETFRTMMESLRGPDASAAVAAPASPSDAVVAASLAEIEPALGQAVALRVQTLRQVGDWAYLAGVPTRPDGSPLDWLSTPLAGEWQADAMSDLVMVLLVQESGSWRVVDHVIGPTDVYWLGWVAQYGLPETLFYEP